MATDHINLRGRVLFLSEDDALLQRQFHGENLPPGAAAPLRQRVCADEILPEWVSFYFYQRLGDFPYLGLQCRGNFPVSEGSVRRGGFEVVVSGREHGLGASKDGVPFAERASGIRLIIAESFDPGYLGNCHALGLLTSTDFGLLERIRQGQAIPLATFTAGLDSLTAEIVRSGGSFAYTRARLRGEARLPLPAPVERPQTLAEKILARAARADLGTSSQGLATVSPGDGLLVKADWRISHESGTLLAASMLLEQGEPAPFSDPDHILAFRDHLAFKQHLQTQDQRQPGLTTALERMNSLQVEFCASRGIHLHGETAAGASVGISHILMVDNHILPGQVVLGTDSHTGHCGALGALGLAVGGADMANAWITGDVPFRVPGSCLVRLNGRLPAGVCAKDLVLHLLTLPAVREGRLKGHILEYQGEALLGLSTDERSTLASMAVELGAVAGLLAPDQETQRFLVERRGLEMGIEPWLRADPDAHYAFALELDCASLGAMVAAPGHPGNGIRVEHLGRDVGVDIAYVGSCTGGKREDIERAYEVVKWALDHDLKLPLQVQLFIQLGSEDVRGHAQRMGWLELFERAGARILPPGCGACINAGPGISSRDSQVTISAVNRNFPGRSGPGQVWLASPATVTASAFCGKVSGFAALGG